MLDSPRTRAHKRTNVQFGTLSLDQKLITASASIKIVQESLTRRRHCQTCLENHVSLSLNPCLALSSTVQEKVWLFTCTVISQNARAELQTKVRLPHFIGAPSGLLATVIRTVVSEPKATRVLGFRDSS